MFKDIKTRIKRNWPPSTDSVIDFMVDMLLLFWDIISSPILIVMRLLRMFMKKAFGERLKRFIKWFVHRVLRIK